MSLTRGAGLSLSLSLIVFLTVLLTSFGAFADHSGPYVGERIVEARFGAASVRNLLQKAENLSPAINKIYFGQPEVSQFVERRAIEWAMNINKSPKPTVINLLGLHGTGKSDLVAILERELGVPAIRMDVQTFATDQRSFAGKLREAVKKPVQENRPVILGIDEVDKVFEVDSGLDVPKTHPIIGVINQIVENGTIFLDDAGAKPLELKNVLVVLNMNFPDQDLQRYAALLPGANAPTRSFYDLSWDELKSLDALLRQGESKKFEMLSRMFRAHTVNRLGPRTIIMNSWLSFEDRKKLVQRVFNEEHSKLTASADVKLSLKWADAVVHHITETYVYAPGGPRGLMAFAQTIFRQAMHAALRHEPTRGSSLRPRDIELKLSDDTKAVVAKIQTWKRVRGQTILDHSSQIILPFSEDGRDLVVPQTGAMPSIVYHERTMKDGKPRPFTKKQIAAARFPEVTPQLKTLPKFLGSRFFGRENEIENLCKRLSSYLRRDGPSRDIPDFLVWPGLQGTGKSELAEQAAKHLGIPIRVINLQDYQSDEEGAKSALETQISLLNDDAIGESKGSIPKYMLMFDEVDKLREINEKGEGVSRPAIAVIKSILSRGEFVLRTEDGVLSKVSLRGAFIVFNMNFGRDIMDFSADPRLTSAADVEETMKETFKSPDLVIDVLKTLFLPETINRLSPYVQIVAPLKQSHFEQIARRTAKDAVNEYFQTINEVAEPDEETLAGVDNAELQAALDQVYEEAETELLRDLSSVAENSPAAVHVKFAPAYLQFLYENGIVPSEGGRYTALAVKAQVRSDVDIAMKTFPRSSRYAKLPVQLTLDFDAKTSTVSSSILPKSDLRAEPLQVETHTVLRAFPPLAVDGPVSAERMFVAIHEFGHAFLAVGTGVRINNILVEQLVAGSAGYVEQVSGLPLSANQHLASILVSLGSRAMERVIKAQDPKSAFSVFEASTAGASADIAAATKELYSLLHKFGLNPYGGTIDRSGGGMMPYANFTSLPQHEVRQIERILRLLEDEMVNDLLAWHPRSWYVERIIRLAQAGVMNEAQFYDLLGYLYPGRNEIFLGDSLHTLDGFAGFIAAEPEAVSKARQTKRTDKGVTPAEVLQHYRDVLFKALEPKTEQTACGELLPSK